LVIKFADDCESIAQEIKILKKILKKSETSKSKSKNQENFGFPKLIDYGMFIVKNLKTVSDDDEEDENTKDTSESLNSKIFGFYIMPKCSLSLQDYIDFGEKKLKPFEILFVMFQVINTLKHLHSIGFTHNDIKPSNIMISETFSATLIDFGFA
jgi:serine/threonine protein kinase